MATQKFEIKEAVIFGWETFKKNWKFLVIFFAIIYVVNLVLSALSGSLITETQKNPSLINIIFTVISIIVGMVINIGVIVISLKLIDHKNPSYRDLYVHYPLLKNYFLASLLFTLIFVGGLILLIIPGIIWGIKYQYFSYLVVDKKQSPMNAIKMSGKITQGNKWRLFLLGLVFALIYLAGVLVFQIGTVISTPVIAISGAYVYRKLAAQS